MPEVPHLVRNTAPQVTTGVGVGLGVGVGGICVGVGVGNGTGTAVAVGNAGYVGMGVAVGTGEGIGVDVGTAVSVGIFVKTILILASIVASIFGTGSVAEQASIRIPISTARTTGGFKLIPGGLDRDILSNTT